MQNPRVHLAPAAPAAAPAPAAVVPFVVGTYEYSEIMATYTFTLGTTMAELAPLNITPGGFLRGVTIYVTSSAGVLGTGVLSADAPWSLFNYITLENIDGTPIIYPMDGYAQYLCARFTRPWAGDPALDPSLSNTINPAFRLTLFNEARATLAVLANTDARAQYRLRIGINPLSNANPSLGLLTTLGTATTPTVTLAVALETYAMPPAQTLQGAPIQQSPDGVGMQRFLSRQVFNGVGTGTNTLQLNRTGNLVRSHIAVVRDSTGVRTDLTADPIRLRIDNTQLFVENRTRRDYEMLKFFTMLTSPGIVGVAVRPTGVYVFPRWQQPGRLIGQSWLETTQATFVLYELQGAPAAGSIQFITEDLAPVAPVAAYLENI